MPLPSRFLLLAIALLVSSSGVPAQDGSPATDLTSLAPGLTIPVILPHALRAGRTPVSTPIIARTTQRIPLGPERFLASGAKVLGTVVTSTAPDPKSGIPATLTLRFTALRDHGRTISIRTAALAIANFVEVWETVEPASLPTDRANPSASNWTTAQVGGDEIARSDWKGPLTDTSGHQVGFADFNGVYANPAPGSTLPRALGVFSATASGLYGFGEGASLNTTQGAITISAPGKLILRRGDNLLLEVVPPSSQPAYNPTAASAR